MGNERPSDGTAEVRLSGVVQKNAAPLVRLPQKRTPYKEIVVRTETGDFTVTFSGHIANEAEKFGTAGARVDVSGILKQESWETREGKILRVVVQGKDIVQLAEPQHPRAEDIP